MSLKVFKLDKEIVGIYFKRDNPCGSVKWTIRLPIEAGAENGQKKYDGIS